MVDVRQGFTDDERLILAQMFWDAFQGKLEFALAPERKAVPFLATVLNPTCIFVARDAMGQVLGAVGFKSGDQGLFGGTLADMTAHYGWVGGLWRGFVLDLFERPAVDQQLLMDGIFVGAGARGQGVGTTLLTAIRDHAATMGATHIRLDVVDGNDGAQRLYHRFGFYDVKTAQYGPLRHVMGITASTEMRLDLT